MLTKYAQILTLGPFKKYVRFKGGRRGCSKSAKTYKGRGSSKSVHTTKLFLNRCFHILGFMNSQ